MLGWKLFLGNKQDINQQGKATPNFEQPEPGHGILYRSAWRGSP